MLASRAVRAAVYLGTEHGQELLWGGSSPDWNHLQFKLKGHLPVKIFTALIFQAIFHSRMNSRPIQSFHSYYIWSLFLFLGSRHSKKNKIWERLLKFHVLGQKMGEGALSFGLFSETRGVTSSETAWNKAIHQAKEVGEALKKYPCHLWVFYTSVMGFLAELWALGFSIWACTSSPTSPCVWCWRSTDITCLQT